MTDFIKQIDQLRYNPSGVMELVYEDLEARQGAAYVPADATNPFNFLIDTAVNLSCANMIRNDANNRRQYAKVATTAEEIYLHMSDVDYIGRFSMPGQTHVYIDMPMEALLAHAVRDNTTGIRKVTLGRHSQIQIAGVKLGWHYPVEIRILPSGNINVVYDPDIISPLETLRTNLVEHQIVNHDNLPWLRIKLPVHQFERITKQEPLNASTGFVREYSFSDEFYHCRVYTSNNSGQWTEVKTTHSDQLYNPSEVTCVLTRLDGKLRVQFPQVYFTNGKLSGQVRIDIFTTKGELSLPLRDYVPGEFGWRWEELDDQYDGKYTSAIHLIKDIMIFSDGTIAGGRAELTLDELRDKVVMNVDEEGIPVSIEELNALVNKTGFRAIYSHDDVTDRGYLITQQFPVPDNHDTRTPIGSSLELFQVNQSQLQALDTVRYDEDTTTILSSSLFEKVNGRIQPVSNSVRQAIDDMNAEERVVYVNEHDLLYTPYLYSIDVGQEAVTVKPFYMDNPTITSRQFVAENERTPYQCSTREIQLVRTETGYRATILTASSDDIKALTGERVKLQVSFVPDQEVRQAYSMAVLDGRNSDNERVFVVDITTDFLFNTRNDFLVSSLDMFEEDLLSHAITLVSTMNLYYIINDALVPSTDIDDQLGVFQLEENDRAITHEQVHVKFGDYLERLRCRYRRIPVEVAYKTHPSDVYETWTRNIPERDLNNVPVYNNVDGKVVPVYKHMAGDPVLDENGDPKVLYPAGSTIYDEQGNPIPVVTPDILYQFEIVLFDATYRYCTEDAIADYLRTIPTLLASWVTDDAVAFNDQLLERTTMYVAPARTAATATISVTDGDSQTIDAEQSVFVTAYVDSNTYENTDLREQLSNTIKDIINEEISKQVVSLSSIGERITDNVNEIHSIRIDGLGPDNDLYSLQVIGNGDALSIRKVLDLEPNGTISIRDDISVGFIRQTITA